MRDRVLCEAECERSTRVPATPTSRSLRRARGKQPLGRLARGVTGKGYMQLYSMGCLALPFLATLARHLILIAGASWGTILRDGMESPSARTSTAEDLHNSFLKTSGSVQEQLGLAAGTSFPRSSVLP